MNEYLVIIIKGCKITKCEQIKLAKILKIIKPDAKRNFYPFLLRPDASPHSNMWDIWTFYKQKNNTKVEITEPLCANEYGLCE